MPGTLYAYAAGAKKTVTDVKAYNGGARYDVKVVYSYNAGRRELSWWRTSVQLSASAASYSSVSLSWTAPSFPVSNYIVKRGGTQIYSGTGTSKSDTGLSASTTYDYTIDAYYDDGGGGVLKESDSASATTPARPTSTGTITPSPAGGGSGTGNTSSTAKSLTGLNFSMSVAGYLTGVSFWAHGYSSKNGYGTVFVNGVNMGSAALSQNGGYNTIPIADWGVGTGSFTTRMDTGGNSTYWTEWRPYSGGAWSTNIEWNAVTYWYYTSLKEGSETEYERSTHTHTWQDRDGNTVAERVTDKETGELISEFGEIPEPPPEPISEA